MKTTLGLMLLVISIASECGAGWYSWVMQNYASRVSHLAIRTQSARAGVTTQDSASLLVSRQRYLDMIDRLPNTRYTVPLKRLHGWQRLDREKSKQNR